VLFENDTEKDFDKKIASPLPLLAGICETIGVGRVTNTWANGEGVYIAVENYWRGNPGVDTLSVPIKVHQPPVSDTPLVFLLLSRSNYARYNLGDDYGYTYIFNENNLKIKPILAESYKFLRDDRSWFHVNDTNANLVAFASNLVVAVTSSNTNMFYEVIRDGYRLNPVNSRIHEDSYFAFGKCNRYFTTNFMEQVLSDPLLIGEAHYGVRFNLFSILNNDDMLDIYTNGWWWR